MWMVCPSHMDVLEHDNTYGVLQLHSGRLLVHIHAVSVHVLTVPPKQHPFLLLSEMTSSVRVEMKLLNGMKSSMQVIHSGMVRAVGPLPAVS